jgi:hypothetical protein
MKVTWTSNGKKYPINELEHSHIQNIIKMLWRQNTWLKDEMSKMNISLDILSKQSCIAYLYIVLNEFTPTPKPQQKIQFNGEIAQEMADLCEIAKVIGCEVEELDDYFQDSFDY